MNPNLDIGLWESFKQAFRYHDIPAAKIPLSANSSRQKIPDVENSVLRNFPYGKVSVRQNFRTAKVPYAEISVRRKFIRRKILRQKFFWWKFLAPSSMWPRLSSMTNNALSAPWKKIIVVALCGKYELPISFITRHFNYLRSIEKFFYNLLPRLRFFWMRSSSYS